MSVTSGWCSEGHRRKHSARAAVGTVLRAGRSIKHRVRRRVERPPAWRKFWERTLIVTKQRENNKEKKNKNQHQTQEIFASWKNSFLNARGNQIATFLRHVSKADDASKQCGMEITANLACNSSQLNSTYCTHGGSTRHSFQFTAV